MSIMEREFVIRAKSGDLEAFNALFAMEQKYIFNLVLHLTGDRDQADDLTQETLLTAYRNIRQFRGESRFRTWLTRIALNLFRREWRRRPPHVSICLEQIPASTNEDQPERMIIKRELQWCILHSLQQHVPKAYRMALVLRDLQNYSYREISRILGWSLGKTKTSIHRGRRILLAHFVNGKCHAFAKYNLCICDGILEL